MAVVLGVLSLTFMGFLGYTWALCRIFHHLLEGALQESSQATQRTGEAAVLLRIYLGNLNLAFVLGMIVYGIAKQAADWQSGVLLLLLCGTGGLIVARAWLHPTSQKMLLFIGTELKHLRRFYKVVGDESRMQAVDRLIARLRLTSPRVG